MDMLSSLLTTILGYLYLIRFTDVLDILVVTYLIYKGMTLLRRSSAAQVAKALVLIVAVMWISYQLNLSAINFILGKAMELGLLALVVVFQPEIRRFLEQLGSSNFGRIWTGRNVPTGDVERAIVETVDAFIDLSKNRVGALVVFERHNVLDTVIESGTVMDAAVSSELLKNIFYPKAPLHDGAVVIRNGRIAGAGCMLPLSSNKNLSRELGMRHRAGIGMSEHSDAVVALVSEETGTISVATSSRLRRHLAPETLGRVLRNELVPRDGEQMKRSQSLLDRVFRRKGGQG